MNDSRTILKNSPVSCFADEIDPSVDRQTALMEELGIGWVEFRSGDGKGVADYTEEEAERLMRRLEEKKIRVSAVGSPIGKIGIGDDFEPHLEKLAHVMRLAKIWDTPYIRSFSFFIPEGEKPESFRDEVFRRMDRMVELAARENLILLHENEKEIYGDLAPRCLELMENFGGANLKATFDFANFVQCGQDTLEAYEMLKEHIAYVHVKDALFDGGRVVPAGQGNGRVKEILTRLDAAGFSGFLSLEPHLADFAGLSGLEKNAALRGRSDTEAAFVTAYEALEKLLRG
ncbi:MAG TPA: sugar phosphate isomerase/epimerase [Candidatus Eisenbergiella pullistercoris]|uniref:Sugar phosphate isomerase/epimerase n=1 Tax=Candidatus Eisenbergiella pullistercoris TaxID=2838555 RepID=A0A9D2C6L3_9FIRM|nr:sugar phosphate isomerase/epimerase [Candidatus Eisenbergiella pullistercoris]